MNDTNSEQTRQGIEIRPAHSSPQSLAEWIVAIVAVALIVHQSWKMMTERGEIFWQRPIFILTCIVLIVWIWGLKHQTISVRNGFLVQQHALPWTGSYRIDLREIETVTVEELVPKYEYQGSQRFHSLVVRFRKNVAKHSITLRLPTGVSIHDARVFAEKINGLLR